jgi:hypothetical protein
MATTPVKVISGPATQEEEIKIYWHSPILYWWPVWLAALLMAAWTMLDNYHMVLVPEEAVIQSDGVRVPAGKTVEAPLVHVARSRWPGILFLVTLVFTVFLTTSSLRGPWALFGGAVLVALILLFNWLDWWTPISHWFSLLRVHINLGAYLAVAIPLFLLWALTIFFFDRRTYVVFSTGQVRIRDELGSAEKVYDTMSVSFEKEQYDWLRFLIGLGAGDLLVRTGGAQPTFYELPNVIGVGEKLRLIEERLRTRDVV